MADKILTRVEIARPVDPGGVRRVLWVFDLTADLYGVKLHCRACLQQERASSRHKWQIIGGYDYAHGRNRKQPPPAPESVLDEVKAAYRDRIAEAADRMARQIEADYLPEGA